MSKVDLLKKGFKDKGLFDLALTHRSWVNEHRGERTSNERLEFLGDAILEFIVSKELFKQFPNKEEGYLTALRANIVNTMALAEIAEKLELSDYLFLSKGEEESGGRTNSSLLADTVEAIIGAIYLDQGIDSTEKFISEYFLSEVEKKANEPLKDYKSRLQEMVQARGFAAPKYVVANESGPDHDKSFVVEVVINGEVWGKGEGKSKSAAEQDAACKVLAKKV